MVLKQFIVLSAHPELTLQMARNVSVVPQAQLMLSLVLFLVLNAVLDIIATELDKLYVLLVLLVPSMIITELPLVHLANLAHSLIIK